MEGMICISPLTTRQIPSPLNYHSRVLRLQAGAHVIASEKKRHRTDSQVWYADEGFLINKHSSLVLSIESGKYVAGKCI
ncbi:hypothetical protein BC938DRAFT_482308 [Jimgerdemannia flammicorona]|uniref:Uncharacterized protein n=1 Tax=Jimgerdemannia flammicorona TaxID=994334 RepID=A0A433QE85_9FUNG|nr:hypothetical protein BC938DRAFT_482308 [Jimgerdemannia flammicorona]